jgi:hypothetical protein
MISTWVIAYTPLAQFVVSYLLAYRNEPLRLLHPCRQRTGMTAWNETFMKLGLVGRVPLRQDVFHDIQQILKVFGIPCLLSLLVDLFGPQLSGRQFPKADCWLIEACLQFIPAIILLLALRKSFLGPLPNSPRRVHLMYPRLGSRIRHLGDSE